MRVVRRSVLRVEPAERANHRGARRWPARAHGCMGERPAAATGAGTACAGREARCSAGGARPWAACASLLARDGVQSGGRAPRAPPAALRAVRGRRVASRAGAEAAAGRWRARLPGTARSGARGSVAGRAPGAGAGLWEGKAWMGGDEREAAQRAPLAARVERLQRGERAAAGRVADVRGGGPGEPRAGGGVRARARRAGAGAARQSVGGPHGGRPCGASTSVQAWVGGCRVRRCAPLGVFGTGPGFVVAPARRPRARARARAR
jgi:hypothetical protein